MAKVLVIGQGAREHALAKQFANSTEVDTVFVAPGNPGMVSTKIQTVPLAEEEFADLVDFAKTEEIDLTVVGPELPLQNGIVDEFLKADLRVFGPTKAAAKLENSKHFAKDVMDKAGVKTASYRSFTDEESAKRYLLQVDYPQVIKANGLAAGKGVVIVEDYLDAKETIHEMLGNKKFGTTEVVIEEFLDGEEFSCLAMVNAGQIVQMPLAQDHKAAFDGDLGPNTGGMGAYSPLLHLPKSLNQQTLEEVIQPTIAELKRRDIDFCGFLYAGMIMTKDGLKVIEFNTRMGDPESSVVLPQLKSSLYEVLTDLLDEKAIQPNEVKWQEDEICLGVVVSSEDYPQSSGSGVNLELFKDLPANIDVDFAGVKEDENHQLVSDGGRILCLTTTAKTVKEAQKNIYSWLYQQDLAGLRYRSDIGHRAVND